MFAEEERLRVEAVGALKKKLEREQHEVMAGSRSALGFLPGMAARKTTPGCALFEGSRALVAFKKRRPDALAALTTRMTVRRQDAQAALLWDH